MILLYHKVQNLISLIITVSRETICASINDEVVHGIPSKRAILKEGDIISIDMGAILDGWHSDAARTFGVGKISDEAQNLIDVTRQSFLRELNM